MIKLHYIPARGYYLLEDDHVTMVLLRWCPSCTYVINYLSLSMANAYFESNSWIVQRTIFGNYHFHYRFLWLSYRYLYSFYESTIRKLARVQKFTEWTTKKKVTIHFIYNSLTKLYVSKSSKVTINDNSSISLYFIFSVLNSIKLLSFSIHCYLFFTFVLVS